MFVTEAALIALREGLEALLITGILLGLVVKLGRPDARKHVWFGFAAAVVASIVAGWLVQRYLLAFFEERGGAEWFELGAVAVAVVVLTYMVFWMWKHTRGLMAVMRHQVESALTRGALLSIVLLTFASVIREGLEVVLFYGALAGRASAFDLAWSGLVGLLVSAVIVVALLKGAARFDLAGFFAITGALLVLVAGGLLVHGVSAAMGLGILAPAPSLWDMSALLPDEGAVGRVLHALIGYTSTPTLLQALLYFGYLGGIGGAYLVSLGLFHRKTPGGRALRAGRAAAAALALVLIVAAVGMGAANPGPLVSGHEHADSEEDTHEITLASIPHGTKVGVLLRSHGEPVHYNETTYQSFADFIEGLFRVLGMENLLLVDQGTVLLDKAHPFAKGPRLDAQFMDAWTHDNAGPAIYVGSPVPSVQESQVPLFDGFYVTPGGPGLGEPDVLEMAGLSAYIEWLQMENASPMHATKMATLDAAAAILERAYGDRIVIQKSYHVLPRVGAGESDEEAARAFVEAGVGLVVDAYTTTVFSDVMNTCMMFPHLEHALGEAGYQGKLVSAAPSGLTHAYAHAVAGHVRDLLTQTPEDGPVAVFLTHHGADPQATNPCGTGADQYNANAKALFDGVMKAVAEEVTRGDVEYFQVYGQGAGTPDDAVLSPLEALDAAREAGARRVIDIPYELTGDGFDNLVAQRGSYGLAPEDAPHYDAARETRMTLRGLDVRIVSSAFAQEARGAALAEVIQTALVEALGGGATEAPHGH
jgi:high-affinity iron transporter